MRSGEYREERRASTPPVATPEDSQAADARLANRAAGRLAMVVPLSIALTVAALTGGCALFPSDESESPPHDETVAAPSGGDLARARELYEQKRYSEALIECVNISHRTPNAPGLAALRSDVLEALADQRLINATKDAERAKKQVTLDAMESEAVPDTFKLKRYVRSELKSHTTPPGPMRKALDEKVTIHLQGADLSLIIDAISQDKNINVIADQNVGKGKKLDIHLDEVPLREVLKYVSRNLGVDFYVGENVIWATAADAKQAAPLVTRMYFLHKGLQFHGSDWAGDQDAKKVPATADRPQISFNATELAGNRSYIEEVIERFIPEQEGAQLHLDRNTHTLLVRNTAENLELIEKIIETLDVSPPQVLIEARFIEVMVSDLREIGLEWVLDSPLVVSKKRVLEDGTWQRAPRTQVQAGDLLSYTPFTSDGAGTTALGPQGPFGEVRAGNPPTAGQGLNLTYQGILTQPMFQAVLHALEISGKGHTLSVPRVATINNNPAKLRHGDDLRFYEEFKAQAFSLLDANNQKYQVTVLIPSGKPALEELGITLVAVPSVGRDLSTISLLLIPTISKLEGFVNYQDESSITNGISQVVVKLPIVSRREIQTKVVVESGETVVMGGLIETIKQETLHETPFLSALPVLGHLFKRTDVTEQKKNLLVFVTATVVSERGESLVPAARATSSEP